MFLSGIPWCFRPASSDEILEHCADIFHEAIALFGPERCMFESNFPVDICASTYVTTWNALKRIGHEYSEAEQAMMLYDNRIYRLGLPIA